MAVMPGALFEEARGIVFRSPYGGSFGGWALDRSLRLKETREIVGLFIDHLGRLKRDMIRRKLRKKARKKDKSDEKSKAVAV